MFISKLTNVIENYDVYGEYRLNGVKAVYVLLVLFAINLIYTIPNPYFNYFYLPITALAAEIEGETLADKYLLFIYTVVWATIGAFCFSVLRSYPFFFLGFVFFYSCSLYFIVLSLTKKMFFAVPIVLSLASYSLVHGQVNTDFYVALNNSLVTLVALVGIIFALTLFPRSYYFRIWLRAFILILEQILQNYNLIANNKAAKIDLMQSNRLRMLKYAYMLPRKMPTFSILKINLLVDNLRILSCVTDQVNIQITNNSLNLLRHNLQYFIEAVKEERQYFEVDNDNYILSKIINSWNYLCLKI